MRTSLWAQALQVRGRVQHLLHTRPPLGPRTDDDNVAFLDAHSSIRVDLMIAPCLDVANRTAQAAVLRCTRAPRRGCNRLGVGVEGLEHVGGGERMGGAHAAGGNRNSSFALSLALPLRRPIRPATRPGNQREQNERSVRQAGTVQLTQQGGDTMPCAMWYLVEFGAMLAEQGT